MRGKGIYIGISAFLGLLTVFVNSIIFLLFIAYLAFLLMIKKERFPFLCIVLIVFSCFFMKGYMEEKGNQSKLTGNEKQFIISFQLPLKIDGNYFSTFGKDVYMDEKLAIKYYIKTKEEKEKLEQLQAGMICKVNGTLEKPLPATNENGFDYKKYLYRLKVHWILNVDHIDLDQCLKGTNPLHIIYGLRKKGIDYIRTHFPPHLIPIAEALIFGERTSFDPDLLTAYEKLGIVHLLAISGLHVSMLTGMIFILGIRFGCPREWMTNFLLFFLPIYIFLTGASPSVIRASTMMIIILLMSKQGGIRKNALDGLAIVFTCYLFLQPYVFFNIGFQLSFFVTLALILSSNILQAYILKPVALVGMTTFIAQVASIPILLYYFYEISILSIFVNLFFVPMYSMIITPLMLILFILHLLFHVHLDVLFSILNDLFSILNSATISLSNLSISTLILGKPSPFMMTCYFVGIFLFFYLFERTRKKGYFLIPIGLLLFHYVLNEFSLEGEVTMIDVGQGDSFFIRMPLNQGTYLIDTGGTISFPKEDWEERRNPFEVGKDIIVPFLKSKGVRKMDKLIITHGDMDHSGGAMSILEEFNMKEVVLPDTMDRSEIEIEIIKKALEKGVYIRTVKGGDQWKDNVTTYMILSPLTTVGSNRNDQSIVIYTEIGGLRWLFTGDLEEEGERKLISAYPSLTVDVLKVGHHGSKTSTTDEWLNTIKPKVALISAGRNNPFGHPHEEVIERLESKEIKVYRTDQNGAVSYRFFKNKGTFLLQFP